MEKITITVPWRAVVAGLLLLFIVSTTPLALTFIALVFANGLPLSFLFQNDNYLLNFYLLASMIAFLLLLTKRTHPRASIVLAGVFLIYYLMTGFYQITSFMQSLFLFNYNSLSGIVPLLTFLSPMLSVYYISGVNWHQKWVQTNTSKILAVILGFVAVSLLNSIYQIVASNQLQTGYMDILRMGIVMLFLVQAGVLSAAAIWLYQTKKSPLLSKVVFVNAILYVLFFSGMMILFVNRAPDIFSFIFQVISPIAHVGVMFYVAQLLSSKPLPIMFGNLARKK